MRHLAAAAAAAGRAPGRRAPSARARGLSGSERSLGNGTELSLREPRVLAGAQQPAGPGAEPVEPRPLASSARAFEDLLQT